MLTISCAIKNGEKVEMQNGATRTTLCVINKSGQDIEPHKAYNFEVGYLAKGNHRFYFINPAKKCTLTNRYLYIDGGYGVDVKKGELIKQDSSVGGYGNSESTVTLVEGDAILYCHSYKDRTTGDYIKCANGDITYMSPEDATIELYGLDVEIL